MKTLLTMCGSIIIAFSLNFAFWYLLFTGLSSTPVQGPGYPNMTKEEIQDLMDYHGVNVVYIEEGIWCFDRDNEVIPLKQ